MIDYYLWGILLKSILVLIYYWNKHEHRIASRQLNVTGHLTAIWSACILAYTLCRQTPVLLEQWLYAVATVALLEFILWVLEVHFKRVSVLRGKLLYKEHMDITKVLQGFVRSKAIWLYLPYWSFLLWYSA
jgi:hypothetical protein